MSDVPEDNMIVIWFLYNLTILLGFFVYWPWAALKGKRPATFRQRQGDVPAADALRLAGHPVVWIHAVSMGEAQAMQPFLKALKAQYPEWRIALTTVTHTGQHIARTLIGDGDLVAYLPLDLPWAMERFIQRVQPKLFLAVETELWPNALRALQRHGVPSIVVNGRMSPRSFAGYRRARFFLTPLLSHVELFLMQTTVDADRLRALGVVERHIRIVGNLKWDRVETSSVPLGLKQLQTAFNLDDGGLLLVAGSTHQGEEDQVLRVFQRVARDIPQLRCLVAPRHIERVADVSSRARRLGLEPVTYSRLTATPAPQRLGPSQVVIVDTIGHLRHLYALATIAYVGGSLVPKGGQNPLEPAQFGKPILTGPHLTNFRAIADTLNQAGGLRIIATTDELETALRLLLTSPAARARMGEKARSAFQANQGAVERTLDSLRPVLTHWTRPSQPCTVWERGPRGYHWAQRLMREDGGVLRDRLTRAVLEVLSRLYAGCVTLWDFAYRHGWARTHAVTCPVISIGNLTMGGTGKSSCVLWLAQQLTARGFRPAIVTRGYGRRRLPAAPGAACLPPACPAGAVGRSPDGDRQAQVGGEDLGDEPTMFLQELGSVPVLVGWDRVRSARAAVERAGADIILLDDGFQHRRLRRDVDVVTVDAVQAWGNERLLPRGMLREPLTALRRAQVLLVTKTNLPSRTSQEILEHVRAVNPQLLVVRARHEARAVWRASSQCEEPPSVLRGTRVVALSSVGDPLSFEHLLMQLGATVGLAVRFPDHHPYRLEEVRALAQALAQTGLERIVTTTKDWTRLDPLMAQLGQAQPAWDVLKIAFTVDENANVVDRLLRLSTR